MIVNKMKNIALLVVGIFFSQSTFAQNIEFKNSNFKSDKEGLKLAACISPWNLPLYLLTWKIDLTIY